MHITKQTNDDVDVGDYQSTGMMCVHSSRPLSSRVLSYMCLLTSFTDCNSLTNWRSVAHHASNIRCHHHRHDIINRRFNQYSTNIVTSLYNSKLLDEINYTDIAKKWRFALAEKEDHHHHHHGSKDDAEIISNILVCGDGDLSFSAEIASELDALGIDLYASVLEDESTHNTGAKFNAIICCYIFYVIALMFIPLMLYSLFQYTNTHQ